MDILLDTTVQIERIFKRDKKAAIENMISQNDCGSSTFVLGEFKRSMVKDFVTLYNIMQIEEDLVGVRENINIMSLTDHSKGSIMYLMTYARHITMI